MLIVQTNQLARRGSLFNTAVASFPYYEDISYFYLRYFCAIINIELSLINQCQSYGRLEVNTVHT